MLTLSYIIAIILLIGFLSFRMLFIDYKHTKNEKLKEQYERIFNKYYNMDFSTKLRFLLSLGGRIIAEKSSDFINNTKLLIFGGILCLAILLLIMF